MGAGFNPAGIVRGLGIEVGVSEQATKSKEQDRMSKSTIRCSTILEGKDNLFLKAFLLKFVTDDSFVINYKISSCSKYNPDLYCCG